MYDMHGPERILHPASLMIVNWTVTLRLTVLFQKIMTNQLDKAYQNANPVRGRSLQRVLKRSGLGEFRFPLFLERHNIGLPLVRPGIRMCPSLA
jgi:hypothetical protein